MADPQTPAEWMRLARQHELVALAMREDREAAGQAVYHAGLATECALKGYIMKNERLNRWPDRDERPELYSHDINRLMRIAGIVVDSRDPTAPSWHTMSLWSRGQGYEPAPTPRRVARSFVEAAFGPAGAVTWLRLRV